MPNVGFNGATNLTRFTDGWMESGGIGLPTGRAMANGSTACLIVALLGYAAGRSAARTISMTLGSAGTAGFVVGAAGAAASTGYIGTSAWLVNGGSAAFRITSNGSFYGGQGGVGTTSTNNGGTPFDKPLGGAYTYHQAPTAPATRSITVNPGVNTEAVASWTAPSDNGESAITGYRLRWWYSDSPGSVTTVDLGNVLTHTITGLTPGKTVVFDVAAKNAVTTAAGSTSVYTASASVALPSGGKVWNGSTLVPGTVKVWNGSTLVPSTSVKVWNGSTLVNAV